jgi:anti-sigma B factor antagonist
MSDFKIVQREQEGVSVLELKGYLDAHTAPKLEEALQNLMKNSRFNIVVNCRDLSYISSAGLGVFMAFIEDVRKHRGDIKLTNMSPKVYNVFDLLGFPLLYEIFKDEQEAITRFFDKSKNPSSTVR